jgi:hypothetical protein
MAVGVRTPGPIHIFAAFRTGTNTPNGNNPASSPGTTAGYYVGTCVEAPEPEDEKFKLPVMNDLSGRSVPFQLVQDGEVWLVMMTLNRFDLDIVKWMRAVDSGVPFAGPAAPPLNVLGSETGFARGTLVMGVSDFQLITVNGYAGTAAAGMVDLSTARTFKTSTIRKYKESTAGTRVLEVAMAIECQNLFDPTTRGFSCYAEGPPQVPLLPIT